MRFPGSVPLRGILFLFSAHASTKPATASGRDQLKRKIGDACMRKLSGIAANSLPRSVRTRGSLRASQIKTAPPSFHQSSEMC